MMNPPAANIKTIIRTDPEATSNTVETETKITSIIVASSKNAPLVKIKNPTYLTITNRPASMSLIC